MNGKEFIWKAPEFRYHEKNPSWYWWSIIIATLLIGLAVWQKNYLFALFLVIAEVLVLSWSSKEPEIIEFKLSDHGLHIESGELYPFGEIIHFSIDRELENDLARIVIHRDRHFSPVVHIHISEKDLSEARAILRARLPEVEHEEHFIESLGRFFRF